MSALQGETPAGAGNPGETAARLGGDDEGGVGAADVRRREKASLAATIEQASGVATVFGADVRREIPGLGGWTLVARADGGSAEAVAALVREIGPPARRLQVPEGLLTWRGLAANWRPPCGDGPIVACGGGAALDAGKLFRLMDARRSTAPPPPGALAVRIAAPPLCCIPTTCGSGSEQTPTASLWDGGRKSALDGAALRPDRALYAPAYVGPHWGEAACAAAWDAISHALESLWSRRSGVLSARLALRALPGLARGADPSSPDWPLLQESAAASGAAIALTRTGIAHALSYPLTVATACPHGLAVGLWALAMTPVARRRDEALGAVLDRCLGVPPEARLRDLWRSTGAAEAAARYVGPEDLRAVRLDLLDPARAGASRFTLDAPLFAELFSNAAALLEGSE